MGICGADFNMNRAASPGRGSTIKKFPPRDWNKYMHTYPAGKRGIWDTKKSKQAVLDAQLVESENIPRLSLVSSYCC